VFDDPTRLETFASFSEAVRDILPTETHPRGCMHYASYDVTTPGGLLLEAVDRISGIVTAHAMEAERDCPLPAAIVDALSTSGVLGMKLPGILGGAEVDLVTQVKVIEALACLDGATAWCAMMWASAVGWPGAFLPDEAIDQMFARGRIPRAAVVIQPTGTAVAVKGGYRVSGRWAFASGIRHADWLSAGVRIRARDSVPRGHLIAVFPAAAARIADDWHTVGLEGTGSCRFSVDDLFVSTAFTWDFAHDAARRGGPLYRLGWPGFVAHESAAFALGAGRSAMSAMIRSSESGQRGATPALGESPAFQRTVGTSELRLRAARALSLEVCEAAWAHVSSGKEPSPRLQAEMRSVAAFTSDTASDIAVRAFRAGGSATVYRSHPLQRCVRDLLAAGQDWLAQASAIEGYGQFVLGTSGLVPKA
jgi:alkylation response protein AidB-like acyl-CoA dehydrogenase